MQQQDLAERFIKSVQRRYEAEAKMEAAQEEAFAAFEALLSTLSKRRTEFVKEYPWRLNTPPGYGISTFLYLEIREDGSSYFIKEILSEGGKSRRVTEELCILQSDGSPSKELRESEQPKTLLVRIKQTIDALEKGVIENNKKADELEQEAAAIKSSTATIKGPSETAG